MSAEWVPPRPGYHLRIFAVSLAVVIACLLFVLFGVQLEAVVPATGIIVSRDLHEVRARLTGLVEPGWFDGQAGEMMVRIDTEGNGVAADGRAVRQGQVVIGERRLEVQHRQFHRLQAGDTVWPGQPVAVVRDESLRLQLMRLEDQLQQASNRDDSYLALSRERDRLRDYQLQGTLRAPESAAGWLVVDVRVAPLQKASAGDVLATLVPVDPQTGQPIGLAARLEVEEKHWAGVAVGQKVRLNSSLYNPRLHGWVEGVIDRLEPSGAAVPGGDRRFRAMAPITVAPSPLALGSSFQAEIIVGRKQVYRLIIEH